MAEPASRIESVNSFREPEGREASSGFKGKQRLRPRPLLQSAKPSNSTEAGEADASEEHKLDTLA
jgi:hypothetical protein